VNPLPVDTGACDDVMKVQRVTEWCREFHDFRQDIHSDNRTGRSSTYRKAEKAA
jgi:hypothetical protein